MRAFSRREFFRRFRDGALDHVDTERMGKTAALAGGAAAARAGSGRDHACERGWASLGPLSRFAAETTTLLGFRERDGRLLVVSRRDGMYAVDFGRFLLGHAGPRLPLRLSPAGALDADLDGSWPENSVFSVLTGQMTEEEQGG